MLKRIGVNEEEHNLRNKVARGKFYSGVLPAMLVSNWRSNLAVAGGVIACILLAFAVAHLVAAPKLPSPDMSSNVKDGPEQKQAQTDSAIATPKTGSQNQKTSGYKPNCENPTDREDANYCEQRRAADTAKESITLAWRQYVIGWVQAGAGILALLVAGWAAYEAGQAAKAAGRSADTAERALRGLERPHLFFEISEADFATQANVLTINRCPRVLFGFTNFGKTSAILGWLDYDFVHLATLPTKLPYGRANVYTRNRIVRPDERREIALTFSPALSDAAVESLRQGQSFIWLYGKLSYTQALNEVHETEFCWWYDAVSNRFEPYYAHNRMT